MNHLDLFSGIGGFALAAKRTWGNNLNIKGFCEIEPYAQKVLEKNFPGVPIYKDIKELDGNKFKNIDLLTGGFPCQDISIAGYGAGIEGERSGLWSEMFRIISEIRPRFALIENVSAITFRGGTRVISDLAEIGYDTEWQTISAAYVGALHRRNRMWFVSYPSDSRPKHTKHGKGKENIKEGEVVHQCERSVFGNKREFREEICSTEFVRKSNGIPHRMDRIKGLGNAIVPQVAEIIMKELKNILTREK